jgi:hypothetical protein
MSFGFEAEVDNHADSIHEKGEVNFLYHFCC